MNARPRGKWPAGNAHPFAQANANSWDKSAKCGGEHRTFVPPSFLLSQRRSSVKTALSLAIRTLILGTLHVSSFTPRPPVATITFMKSAVLQRRRRCAARRRHGSVCEEISHFQVHFLHKLARETTRYVSPNALLTKCFSLAVERSRNANKSCSGARREQSGFMKGRLKFNDALGKTRSALEIVYSLHCSMKSGTARDNHLMHIPNRKYPLLTPLSSKFFKMHTHLT